MEFNSSALYGEDSGPLLAGEGKPLDPPQVLQCSVHMVEGPDMVRTRRFSRFQIRNIGDSGLGHQTHSSFDSCRVLITKGLYF